jgi:hypothetical protein
MTWNTVIVLCLIAAVFTAHYTLLLKHGGD